MAVQFAFPFADAGPWIPTRDGDPSVREVYDRHYSRRHYRDGRSPKIYVGPGSKMVLRTAECDAIFVWRRFISKDDQTGVNCAVFRNEGTQLSSWLIRQADLLAWAHWPGEQRPLHVRRPPPHPLLESRLLLPVRRWRKVGITKDRGLTILAIEAPATNGR